MFKILLIEDEPLVQNSLKRLLEKKGGSVTVESSGQKAIEKILETEYDRIICDLMLRDTTGFDVIEESKKKYSIEQISELFIIITAYSSYQVIEKAKEYGCEIITKPFDDINEAIEKFLRGSSCLQK